MRLTFLVTITLVLAACSGGGEASPATGAKASSPQASLDTEPPSEPSPEISSGSSPQGNAPTEDPTPSPKEIIPLNVDSLFAAMPSTSDVLSLGFKNVELGDSKRNWVANWAELSNSQQSQVSDGDWTSARPIECEPIQQFAYPRLDTEDVVVASAFWFSNDDFSSALVGEVRVWESEEVAQANFDDLRTTVEDHAIECSRYEIRQSDGDLRDQQVINSETLGIGESAVWSRLGSIFSELGVVGAVTYNVATINRRPVKVGKRATAFLRDRLALAQGIEPATTTVGEDDSSDAEPVSVRVKHRETKYATGFANAEDFIGLNVSFTNEGSETITAVEGMVYLIDPFGDIVFKGSLKSSGLNIAPGDEVVVNDLGFTVLGSSASPGCSGSLASSQDAKGLCQADVNSYEGYTWDFSADRINFEDGNVWP